MSVKKLLILAAAGLVSTSALAGGASNYSAPAAMSSEDQVGLYVGVNAGWAENNWKSAAGNHGGSWNSAGGTSGTFAGGVDVGYSFNEWLALELGGWWLPSEAKYTGTAGGTSKWQTWDVYLAGKGTVELYEDLNVFGKFGVAYTRVAYTSGAVVTDHATTSNQNNWEPLFGVGLSYNFAQDWDVNAQYMYIMGNNSSDGTVNSAPQNILSLGVAYTFAM